MAQFPPQQRHGGKTPRNSSLRNSSSIKSNISLYSSETVFFNKIFQKFVVFNHFGHETNAITHSMLEPIFRWEEGYIFIYGQNGPIPRNFEIFGKKTLFRNYIGEYHFLWNSSFLNSSSKEFCHRGAAEVELGH